MARKQGSAAKAAKASSGQFHAKGVGKGRILKENTRTSPAKPGQVRRERADVASGGDEPVTVSAGYIAVTTPGGPREKRSVTLDAAVATGVDRHVDRGVVDSFSAAVNEAAARWVANQDLRMALDETYEQDPESRPSEDEIRDAAVQLGFA